MQHTLIFKFTFIAQRTAFLYFKIHIAFLLKIYSLSYNTLKLQDCMLNVENRISVHLCLENRIRTNHVFARAAKVKFSGFFFGLLMLVYIPSRIFHFIHIELHHHFYKFSRKKLFVILGLTSEVETRFNLFQTIS